MQRSGCEVLFDTASFWASRLEYNAEKDCYEILDVIYRTLTASAGKISHPKYNTFM